MRTGPKSALGRQGARGAAGARQPNALLAVRFRKGMGPCGHPSTALRRADSGEPERGFPGFRRGNLRHSIGSQLGYHKSALPGSEKGSRDPVDLAPVDDHPSPEGGSEFTDVVSLTRRRYK